VRSVFGIGGHDEAEPKPFSGRAVSFRFGVSPRLFAIVEYLLSELVASCHDISRERRCKRAQRKRRCQRNKIPLGAFFSRRSGFAGGTERRVCVSWLGVRRRACLARPSKSP